MMDYKPTNEYKRRISVGEPVVANNVRMTTCPEGVVITLFIDDVPLACTVLHNEITLTFVVDVDVRDIIEGPCKRN